MMGSRCQAVIRIVLLATVFIAATVGASSGQTRTQAPTGTVQVVRDEVTSSFPQGLTFLLDIENELDITEADVLFAIGENRTLIQSSAGLTDVPDTSIEHFVDMVTLGVPSGVTLTYHWQLETDDGATLSTPAREVDWIDDRYPWTTYETEDVLLYGYSGDDDFYQRAANTAQTAVTQYQDRFQAPKRPERLRIWLYESQQDMNGSLSPNSREWIAGVSYARYSLIAVVVSSGSDYLIGRNIPHEVAHQIIYDATLNPFIFPATWLDEGIAMAAQTVDLEGLDEMVEKAYVAGTLPTIQSLVSEFGSEPGTIRLSYASSYSVVSYLEETRGPEIIDQLIAAYAEGLSHDAVLMSVMDTDTAGLNVQWREYLESQIDG